MEWIIYKHTNNVNGKVYVGQTKQAIKERWRNGKGYKNNLYFYNSIQKYGWENFSHEILEKNINNISEANKREIYWIKKFDSFKNGYNLTSGGDSRDHLGVPVLQIDKTLTIINAFKSIRDAENATGINHSHISRCCRYDKKDIMAGGFYWCFQNEWNENWNPKKRKPYTAYNKQEVYQIDKGLNIVNKFESLLDAQKTTGINDSVIGQCCRGKNISAGGFYWCFVKDYNDFMPLLPGGERQVVRVDKNDFENIKIYKNISDAAKDNNIQSPEVISRVCKGKQISAGNYYWVYLEDFDFEWKPRKNENFTRVRCVETNVIYNSIKEAAEHTGASLAIKRCCKNPNLKSGGYHWEYVDK